VVVGHHTPAGRGEPLPATRAGQVVLDVHVLDVTSQLGDRGDGVLTKLVQIGHIQPQTQPSGAVLGQDRGHRAPTRRGAHRFVLQQQPDTALPGQAQRPHQQRIAPEVLGQLHVDPQVREHPDPLGAQQGGDLDRSAHPPLPRANRDAGGKPETVHLARGGLRPTPFPQRRRQRGHDQAPVLGMPTDLVQVAVLKQERVTPPDHADLQLRHVQLEGQVHAHDRIATELVGIEHYLGAGHTGLLTGS
jgi:hypothetical protein